MTTVEYSPAALADLRDIAFYIAADNPARALTFVEELREKAMQIARHPQGYPACDELLAGLRKARHGRYVLFYRLAEDVVRIERVIHAARDTSMLFGEQN